VRDHASATHLYRIAQEAINNAVKHGKARQIAVGLAAQSDQASLTVTDDGCGLVAKPEKTSGMGLRIMKYRAGMIGATLEIRRRARVAGRRPRLHHEAGRGQEIDAGDPPGPERTDLRERKMSAKILEIFSGRRGEAGNSPVEKLTDREFEVFQLIGQGKGTKEIAAQLGLSPKTVEVHRLNIKQKLKLQTAAELIRYAVRWVEIQNTALN
jgi:DNA-binding CsgD family transcriptional regulator